jgi:hypothetical protein
MFRMFYFAARALHSLILPALQKPTNTTKTPPPIFASRGRATVVFIILKTAVPQDGFAQDFEADAGCVFSTRTLRCVERKAQAADGPKIAQNRPH